MTLMVNTTSHLVSAKSAVPHLPLQQYKVNNSEHVLDQTRVSVSKRCSKVKRRQQPWGLTVKN